MQDGSLLCSCKQKSQHAEALAVFVLACYAAGPFPDMEPTLRPDCLHVGIQLAGMLPQQALHVKCRSVQGDPKYDDEQMR